MNTQAPCGCPVSRRITDQATHDTFHTLVIEQGGPAGRVDANSLRASRGHITGTLPGETILDTRARQSGKRASGVLREASR